MIRWQGCVLNFLYKLAGSIWWVSSTGSGNNNNYRILFCFQVILQVIEEVSYKVPFDTYLWPQILSSTLLFPKVHRKMFNLILPVLKPHEVCQVITVILGMQLTVLVGVFKTRPGKVPEEPALASAAPAERWPHKVPSNLNYPMVLYTNAIRQHFEQASTLLHNCTQPA